MATRQLSGDTTANDFGIFQGHLTVLYQISQKRRAIRQKLLRQLIGNHTLAFD